VAVSVVMAQQPEVSFQSKPFLVVWGLLFAPTFVLWIAFVTAVYALTRSRYATYAAGFGAISLTGWWATTGDMTWLTNWPLATIFSWSDLSVFELDRTALVLNRLTALGLAAFLGLVAIWAYGRREGDGTHRRTIPGRVRIAAAALAALPLLTGFLLWSHVHRSFQGDTVRERQKEYWRENVGTWGPSATEPTLPEVVHVDLDLDLDPADRAFQVEGTYHLANRTEHSLPWLPVTGGLFWEQLEWNLDGRPAEPEDRSGLHLFHLPEPLPPGGELRLGFRYRGVLNPGSTRNGQPPGTFEFLLDSGVVVTARNPDFVPVLGYQTQIGIDDDNRYESRIYPRNFHEGITPGDLDRSWFTHELRISAPADFTVNSTGYLGGVEESDGRKTWTWTTDYPVRVWNVIAGRYQVRRGEGTAVFYDKRHPWNVDSLLEALDASRRYFGEWYHPYPWRELRLSEFPGIVFYARGNATNIFFSEGTGFLTAPDERVDQAFTIAAHEAAHSWWGHLMSNGAGPGGIVLSEGGAHFATLMLLEQVRGPLQRMAFARYIESLYG
ncbi:MAG: hypothetical protein MI919_16985, partial [Holophagales bacterium]|nr:hypothetical protein [Holophagales bacterium]